MYRDCRLGEVKHILTEVQEWVAQEKYFCNFTSQNLLDTDILLYDFLRVCGRSMDTVAEFSGYYCLRLVLDLESPLATYFMDLFCYLYWAAEELYHSNDIDYTSPFLHLSRALSTVVKVCQDLYCSVKFILPEFSKELLELRSDWSPAHAKGCRMFSNSAFHSRTRALLHFQDLDCTPDPRVEVIEDQKLGSGSFGSVYKGRFVTKDGQPLRKSPMMAIKMLSNAAFTLASKTSSFGFELSAGSQEEQVFEELTRLGSVQHPNVVRPMGFIGHRYNLGNFGIVMELMYASLYSFLEELVEQNILLEVRDMVDLILEIAKGMRFVHECGLIHRDLKPKNVLLKQLITLPVLAEHNKQYSFWEVKLADFGCTKITASLPSHREKLTSCVGTKFYMAPEVFMGSQDGVFYTEKADVFSFGTTCFNVLTSNPEPDIFGPNFYSVIENGSQNWINLLQQQYDGNGKKVPKELLNLIEACWQKNPDLRPSFTSICSFLSVFKQKLLSLHVKSLEEGISSHTLNPDIPWHWEQRLQKVADVRHLLGKLEDWITSVHSPKLEDWEIGGSVANSSPLVFKDLMRSGYQAPTTPISQAIYMDLMRLGYEPSITQFLQAQVIFDEEIISVDELNFIQHDLNFRDKMFPENGSVDILKSLFYYSRRNAILKDMESYVFNYMLPVNDEAGYPCFLVDRCMPNLLGCFWSPYLMLSSYSSLQAKRVTENLLGSMNMNEYLFSILGNEGKNFLEYCQSSQLPNLDGATETYGIVQQLSKDRW